MIRLSAFADEISRTLEDQLTVLMEEGIDRLDLRSVDDINVLDLSDERVAAIADELARRQVSVAAIASPLGKSPIDAPFEDVSRKLERALELADRFQAPCIRVFSFYPPASDRAQWPAGWRNEVMGRLGRMAETAARSGVMLVHENEKDIYGDTAERCLDLLRTVNSSYLRAAFDPANFIQCNQIPFPDAYYDLRNWIGYVHVKDARADGTVVTAGRGEARWPDLLAALRADGYEGIFSLEPHLAAAGRLRGFSGVELFREASRSFRELAGEPRRGS